MMLSRMVIYVYASLFLFGKVLNAEPNTEDNKGFVIISTSTSPSTMETPESGLTKLERLFLASDNTTAQLLKNLEKKVSHIEKTIKNVQHKDEMSNTTNTNTTFQNIDSQNQLPRNCKEVQQKGRNTSGIYLIQPKASIHAFMVQCDMEAKGGGWTLFLNRFDGSQNFHLGWNDYKVGFGNLAAEFWLGLDHLYQLTGEEINELLVELEEWNSVKTYAHYRFFSVGSEIEGYSLKLLGGYSGDAVDTLAYHVGCKFTTKDRDQDTYEHNCAVHYTGGWWYKRCMLSHLTGKYSNAAVQKNWSDYPKIMKWKGFRGDGLPIYRLKKARMMVRPKNDNF